MADIDVQYSRYFDPDSYVINNKSYVPLCVTSHADKDKAVVHFDVYRFDKKTTIKRVGTIFKVEGWPYPYLKFNIDNIEYVLDIKDKGLMATMEKFKERNLVSKSYVRNIDATLNWLLNQDDTFKYQILGRLQFDCQAYTGNEERLWAHNVEDHIECMRAVHKNLKVKPEWLSLQQIEKYSEQMKHLKYSKK